MQNNTNERSAFPKRRIAAVILILAVCMAAAFAIGRGISTEVVDDEITLAESTLAALDTDKSPDEAVTIQPGGVADYGGQTFKILVAKTERVTGFGGGDAPTFLSNTSSEAAERLAFDLNLAIKTVTLEHPISYVMAAKAANEGDTADLLVLDLYADTASALNHDTTDLLAGGLLADLKNVSGVDLGSAGYYKDINDALSVCSRVYLAASDATVGFRDSLQGVIFDKRLVDAGALGALAESGKWTLDALAERVKALGDNGLDTNCDDAVVWMLGMGARDAVPTAEGFRVSVTDGNAIENFSRLKKLLYGGVRSNGTVGSDGAAFRLGTVGEFGTLDKSVYGILPLPKAGESEQYVSVADPASATVLAITSFCNDPARSGKVMNLLVNRSHEELAANYAADVCGADEVSRKSIELMQQNRAIYVIAVLGYPDTLEDACETLILGKNDDPAAFLKQRSYFLQNALDIIVSDVLESIEEAQK